MISTGSISGGSLPLAFLPEGRAGTVLEIRGGHGAVRHLEHMGFAPPARVFFFFFCPQGAMLVMVKDSRIAVGRGIAMKLLGKGVYDS